MFNGIRALQILKKLVVVISHEGCHHGLGLTALKWSDGSRHWICKQCYVFSEELPLNPPSGGVATISQQETHVCLASTQVDARLSVRIALQQRTKPQQTVDHPSREDQTRICEPQHQRSGAKTILGTNNTDTDITFSPMLSTWVLLSK